MAEDGHISLLAAEVGRLHAAVQRLAASNAELKAAIAEQEDDEHRTFKTAIEVGMPGEHSWPAPQDECRRSGGYVLCVRPINHTDMQKMLSPQPWHLHAFSSCCRPALQENIVVIAKYRAQAERLEAELAELRAGRQPLGTAQALLTQDLTTRAAAAAAEGVCTQQEDNQQQQQQQQQGQSGQDGDVAMGEATSQDWQASVQPAPKGGGGMWM